jgi:ABC-type siderophore export system fused ATPase/permease subunit
MEDPNIYRKLGEIEINKEAFELDLKINEGYQNYSAELLRLSLLILSGLGAVWIKLYLPEAEHHPAAYTGIILVLAFLSTALAAGAALIHRYTAADSLAYHLTALRRRARNRPKRQNVPSDAELAAGQDKKRDARFLWSGRLLRLSAGFLFSGLLIFGVFLTTLMF